MARFLIIAFGCLSLVTAAAHVALADDRFTFATPKDHPPAALVAKAGGYDALYVDMEHSPYSIDTAATICAAAIGVGITPLVRVPSHDGHWSSRVLDGGAQGVIVPHVNNRAEAEAVVRNCRFPPLGRRSVMGLGPALGYRAMPLGEIN